MSRKYKKKINAQQNKGKNQLKKFMLIYIKYETMRRELKSIHRTK